MATNGLIGMNSINANSTPASSRSPGCCQSPLRLVAARVTFVRACRLTSYSCFWIVNSKYRGVKFTTESAEGWLIMDS